MDDATRTKIAKKVLDPNTLRHEITPLYTDASLRWRRTVVLPYGGAYKVAFDSFEKAVKAQARQHDELAKLKFELTMAALAIVGGGLLTALYGQATLKAVGKEKILDYVCNKNMEKTFKAMHFVETDPLASFVTGQIWDKAEAQALVSIKTKLAPKTGRYLSLVDTGKKPEQILENMEKFNLELRERGIDTIIAVRKSNLSDQKKLLVIKEILKSPYLNPPKKELNKAKLIPKMELALFMQLLTKSDKKLFTKIGPARNRARFLGIKSQPRYFYRDVSKSANASDYPEKTGKKIYANGTMYKYDELRMPGIGNTIMRHIDAAFRKIHLKKSFFTTGDYWDPNFDGSDVTSIVKRAEKVLSEIGDISIKSAIPYNK
jgi:hypothetical protein